MFLPALAFADPGISYSPLRENQTPLGPFPTQQEIADDIPRVTQKVTKNYLEKGVFITLASQGIEKGKYRSDLIGYHYDEEKSISIEIESASELASHPEHAQLNMEKWRDMGFDMCHSWSESKRLLEVYDSQVTDKENVRAFLV